MTPVVLHVARGREWRGGEQQVLVLAQALAERNAHSQLIVTGRGSRLAQELLSARLPVAGVPWSAGLDPRAAVALNRQIRGLQRDGRQPILHAHDSHALTLALLIGKIRKTPVIATRRSLTVPGALWRRPDGVIAISHAVAESLRDAGVSGERIAVVPSAVAPERLRELLPTQANDAPPHLLAIGALTHEKGHVDLIRALPLTGAEVRLTICGEGAERDALLALVRELNLAERVTIKPTFEEADLRRATLFVQPSVREALGTAVLLAMAQGIPVVASRTGGLIELLDGGAGLLTRPGKPADLASGIRHLLDHPDLRLEQLRIARRRVEDYRPARMAEKVADVYASVF